MKNKTVKYEEAVTRNLKYMKRYPKKYRTAFEDKGIELVKYKLGIRKDDNTHDEKILSIINKEKEMK